MKKYVLIVLIALIVCLFSVSITYSYYSSRALGEANVLVARFKPRLNGSVDSNQVINLRDTADETYLDEYLAPGSFGVIELTLDFSKVDVSADYEIVLGTYDLPDNLQFYTDSTYTELFESFDDTYNITDEPTITHSLYWLWEERDDEESIANDALYADMDLEVPIVVSYDKLVKADYE